MINDILNAANYESLCDYSYYGENIDKNKLLSGNTVIFCKTDYIYKLFEILEESPFHHILITHHSDYSINSTIYSRKPKSIYKWLAINTEIQTSDLITIPLGIKTHKEPFLEPQYKSTWFMNIMEALGKIEKTKLLYCNFSTRTNKYREGIIQTIQESNIPFTYETGITFEQYVYNMSKHKFVISPPGNGIDCHRTWESLYVRCIPIVIKNPIYDNWKELPILQVDSYKDINTDMLHEYYQNCSWNNLEKLYMPFWKNFIEREMRKL